MRPLSAIAIIAFALGIASTSLFSEFAHSTTNEGETPAIVLASDDFDISRDTLSKDDQLMSLSYDDEGFNPSHLKRVTYRRETNALTVELEARPELNEDKFLNNRRIVAITIRDRITGSIRVRITAFNCKVKRAKIQSVPETNRIIETTEYTIEKLEGGAVTALADGTN
jgi:hypothetical protein